MEPYLLEGWAGIDGFEIIPPGQLPENFF